MRVLNSVSAEHTYGVLTDEITPSCAMVVRLLLDAIFEPLLACFSATTEIGINGVDTVVRHALSMSYVLIVPLDKFICIIHFKRSHGRDVSRYFDISRMSKGMLDQSEWRTYCGESSMDMETRFMQTPARVAGHHNGPFWPTDFRFIEHER